jgi:excisionase family DNA binding protein
MEKLYTPEQAGEILQVNSATVREWLKKGKLKGIKVEKLWRIRQSDLEAFLMAGEKAEAE